MDAATLQNVRCKIGPLMLAALLNHSLSHQDSNSNGVALARPE